MKRQVRSWHFSDLTFTPRLPGLVAELISRPVDVIVASGRPAPFAAKAATTKIPIIFVVSLDAVFAGLVDSISRPSGSVTGITHMSDAVTQKRLEIILEVVPRASTIAMLINPDSPDVSQEVRAIKEMTQPRGLELRMVYAKTPDDIDATFASLAANHPDVLVITADPFYLNRAAQLVANAAQYSLPTIYPFREFSAPDSHRTCAARGQKVRRDRARRLPSGRRNGRRADAPSAFIRLCRS